MFAQKNVAKRKKGKEKKAGLTSKNQSPNWAKTHCPVLPVRTRKRVRF